MLTDGRLCRTYNMNTLNLFPVQSTGLWTVCVNEDVCMLSELQNIIS